MNDTTSFRSSVDWWGAPLALAAIVVGLVLSQWRGFNPVPAVVLTLTAAWVTWCLVATRYTVTDVELLVQSGPMKRRVPTSGIERVRAIRSMVSGPALSMDRLEVAGSFGAVGVSPYDRAAFLRRLREVAPTAKFEASE